MRRGGAGRMMGVLGMLLVGGGGMVGCRGSGSTSAPSGGGSAARDASAQLAPVDAQVDDADEKGATMTKSEQRWEVFDGATLILEVSDVPGPILSTAMPPPGVKPVTHPFLSAAARSAIHEHRLREVLLASKDVEDFLERLRAAGFTVKARAQ